MKKLSNRHMKRAGRLSGRLAGRLSGLLLVGALVFGPVVGGMGGCRDLQKRRVEINQPSGANPGLDDRFGLTADAQDPSERDKELGYGRWKQKPETTGTSSPTDPDRRKPF